MKVRFLAGLVAIALGGMTSCSNILEENGVIDNVAQNSMGKLRINLVADGSLNTLTKSGETTIELPESEYGKFKITGTLSSESIDLGTYNEYKDSKIKLVKEGAYTALSGSNGEMDKALDWDCPKFSGTSNTGFTVSSTSDTAASASLKAELNNSVIEVDAAKLTELKNAVTINELYVYQGASKAYPSETEKKFSLLNESSKKLYVKSGTNDIYIVLKGIVKQNSQGFASCVQVKDNGGSATSGKKLYNVQYALSSDQGSLGLTITIDGAVTTENISVSINPYE